jgi:hypothetical protein
MDNDPLDSVDKLKSAAFAVLDCLRRLAPAAVQDGVSGRYPRSFDRITPTSTLSAALV